jgi:hypothetical protein
MSSTIPKKAKTNYKQAPSKKSAIINKGLEKLDTYSSSNAASQSFMDIIKKLYRDRDLQQLSTAVSAMDSLMDNDFNEFGKNTKAFWIRYQPSMQNPKKLEIREWRSRMRKWH